MQGCRREPVAPRVLAQVTERHTRRGPPATPGRSQPRDRRQQVGAQNAAAKDGQERRRIAGDRKPSAAGKRKARELGAGDRQQQTPTGDHRAPRPAGPHGRCAAAMQDLGRWRAGGGARGPPARRHAGDHSQHDAEEGLTHAEVGLIDRGSEIECINRLTNSAHRNLRTEPAKRHAQGAAHQTEHRRLRQPNLADRAFLHAERA